MKNIYGYIRVSTKKQGDGVSLEVQKRDIINFAQNKGLDIVEWFEEQKSASKGYRPEFNRMIEMLYNKKADGFVAHKIDRMMRNRHDWAIINELMDEGINVLSVDGTTLDDANGRFMGDIQAAVATRYSSNLAQETKKGLYGRLEQGYLPFRAPIGYLDNGTAKIKTPDPIKALLIKELFELYVARGYSIPMVKEEIYNRGLRNINGNKVSESGIATILRNSFYVGIIQIKGKQFKGNHEPIISTNTFKKAQEILDGKANAKVYKHDFLFRRMINCHLCGYKLIGEIQKGNIYYRCQTKDCPTKSINESTALYQVYNMLKSIALSESEISEMIDVLNYVQGNWIENQKKHLQTINMQKGALKVRQERVADLLIDGTIDNVFYQEQKKKILFEIQQLEEQENEINSLDSTHSQTIVKFLELAKTPIKQYEIENLSERRNLLKLITSNLALDGKKLMFTMVSPFLELVNRNNFSLCSPDDISPRQMESILVFEDQISHHPLDKEGCERFVKYLIENKDVILNNSIFIPP
jgi:site-specific DNA recombinase